MRATGPVVAVEPSPSSPVIKPEGKSYAQILKSSALIGGSSVVTIAVGIVRTKLMALLLGTAGFGLMGIFGSIADLTRSIAGMGINSSGVRQIAEAVGTGEEERIARTVIVLRRVSLVLGLVGAALLVVFCRQVSVLTFGNDDHVAAVALLSLAVLFRTVSDSQGALIQGMRRVSDLANMTIIGAVVGTILCLPFVYFWRADGVVPSLVAIAMMSLVINWCYSRKVKVRAPKMTMAQIGSEAGTLLKLGFAFMASGLLMMGCAYAIRMIVVRDLGFEAAGYYQAAWSMGGLYVGMILQAMGADFYPRLTGVAKDRAECNRLVNEQAEISLLLAGPGVLATLTCAPLVLHLFYTSEFSAAVGLLRWICLGMALRVISWPMGFIILAQGRQRPFFWSEVAWAMVHIGLAWWLVRMVGVDGAGIAFCGSYIFHAVMIYAIVRQLSGFRWSSASVRIGLIFLSLIALVFTGFYFLPEWLAVASGIAATMLSGVYSIRTLVRLVTWERIPKPVRWLLTCCRVVAPAAK